MLAGPWAQRSFELLEHRGQRASVIAEAHHSRHEALLRQLHRFSTAMRLDELCDFLLNDISAQVLAIHLDFIVGAPDIYLVAVILTFVNVAM